MDADGVAEHPEDEQPQRDKEAQAEVPALEKANAALTEGKVTVLKQGFPDGPVAVTVVGQNAYVLEGQLAALRAPPGSPAAATKPYKATAVAVGKP